MNKKLILRKLWRRIRRGLYWYFRPRYTILSLTLRRGKGKITNCNVRYIPCKYAKGNKCGVHYTLKEPWSCIIAPFDFKDLSVINYRDGYYWEMEDLEALGIKKEDIERYIQSRAYKNAKKSEEKS